jgi:hypothetical protein
VALAGPLVGDGDPKSWVEKGQLSQALRQGYRS